MVTTAEQLDLAPGIGQRQATFRFELIDGVTGERLGEVHPSEDNIPKLSHDTTRTIKRDLGPIDLDVAETAAVNPVRDRVRVSMLLGGGSLPLGVYLFTDETTARRSYGRRINGALVDLGFALDQPRERSFGVPRGQAISVAIGRLLDEAGVEDRQIEGSAASAGVGMTWPSATSSGKILDDLATTGGYLAPWFDNSGTLRAITAFDPALVHADFDFDTTHRIHAESIAETSDLLGAPNRFVVTDNGNTAAPVVGVYDVPSSAPHSFFERGFIIVEVKDIQGLATKAQADAAALALATSRTIFERVTFTTPPDPRHDGWDVIHYDGHNWLELGWSMDLVEGGAMTHVARRAYT